MKVLIKIIFLYYIYCILYFYVMILDNDNNYIKVEMRKRFDLFHHILFL